MKELMLSTTEDKDGVAISFTHNPNHPAADLISLGANKDALKAAVMNALHKHPEFVEATKGGTLTVDTVANGNYDTRVTLHVPLHKMHYQQFIAALDHLKTAPHAPRPVRPPTALPVADAVAPVPAMAAISPAETVITPIQPPHPALGEMMGQPQPGNVVSDMAHLGIGMANANDNMLQAPGRAG
jgi:hypothetical protein